MTYAGLTASMFVYGITLIAALLLARVLGVSANSAEILAGSWSVGMIVTCAVAGAVLFGLQRVAVPRLRLITEKQIDKAARPLQAWVNKATDRPLQTAIILIAGASLFLELVLIRWQGSLFPVFALYKNFTLLACFCGLGIGYAMSRGKLLLPAALPLLALTLAVLTSLRYTGLPILQDMLFFVPVQEEKSVVAGLNTGDVFTWIFFNIPVYLLLIGTFILNVLIMIPVAQFCGALMARVEALKGYGCNLLGSIAGVVLLFALSWLWTGPAVWFALAALPLVWYQLASPVARAVGIVATLAALITVTLPVDSMVQSIYSPYQLIQRVSRADGYMRILSAGSHFQDVYDFRKGGSLRDNKDYKKTVGYYELPYSAAGRLDRVAIVGAGSGNDAAAALRMGAKTVDAVEIDPAIIALGRANHPEQPYANKRVNVINNDARTFFRSTKENYDAIVYSVLDSHILLSHGSNVRLDSFVYTQQGLAEAFARLKPGGLMSVSFTLPNELMGRKIYSMLTALAGAGKPIAIFCGDTHMHTTAFLVKKGGDVPLPVKFLAEHDLPDMTKTYAQDPGKIDLPTDDWPFFYMDAKMYPASYVLALVLVMALAGFLVRGFLPDQKWDKSMLPFFFLGSGFMLVETKAITELGLLFGNTWHVIGVTIIGVLVMAYFANLLAARLKPKSVMAPCVALLATIAAGYAVAMFGGLADAGWFVKLGMILLLTSPMLFSGLVFSSLLKNVKDVPSALAYNLLGAMLGGLLEYNSMQFGFAFLYLLAFALYAAAWVTAGKRR